MEVVFLEVITINNVEMPTPSAVSVELEDIGDMSLRNALGKRLADRVAVKRRVTLKWPRLAPSMLAVLMSAVTDAVFFSAKYPDPITGAAHTATFRAVDRSVDLFRATNGIEWAEVAMVWEER